MIYGTFRPKYNDQLETLFSDENKIENIMHVYNYLQVEMVRICNTFEVLYKFVIECWFLSGVYEKTMVEEIMKVKLEK